MLNTPYPVVPANRHQRRALAAMARQDTLDRQATPWGNLTIRTLQLAFPLLRRAGHPLSEARKEALTEMAGNLARQAIVDVEARWAYDAECGMGKTTLIACLVAAAHQLGSRDSSGRPVSVAIAVSRLDQLFDLHRMLLNDLRLPAETLAVWHAEQNDSGRWIDARGESKWVPSDDSETIPTRPYLLCAHARIRGTNPRTGRPYLEQINEYRTSKRTVWSSPEMQPRSVVLYDETLWTCDTWSLTRTALAADLAYLTESLKGGGRYEAQDVSSALGYLRSALDLIDSELKRQEDQQKPPSQLSLPDLDHETVKLYERILRNAPNRTPRVLLDMGSRSLRVVPVNLGKAALVTYALRIPDSLRNIAVLDASHKIRRMLTDTSIERAPAKEEDRLLKNSRNITFRLHHQKSGRAAMEESFLADRREDRMVSRWAVNQAKLVPEGQAILFFTFKPSASRSYINIPEKLRADLNAAGIDVSATIDTPAGPRPRINIVTFGNENASNDYRHCTKVIFVGVLYRAEDDIAASLVAKKESLLAEVQKQEIHEARFQEVINVLYQGTARSASRDFLPDDSTVPVDVDILTKDPYRMREALLKTHRNAQVIFNDPQVQRQKTRDCADRMHAFLNTCPPETTELTISYLRDRSNSRDETDVTFTKARRLVLSERTDWVLFQGGKRIVRSNG